MAQVARFFDATSYGEADVAKVIDNFYGTSFVIPYGEMLSVESSGAGDATVNVHPGRALHAGYWYENDANVPFVIAAQGGGNNRLDRIVLRTDVVNNTVRLAKIQGAAAAVPALPALLATDTPLFYIWVPDGFGAATTVADGNIHDERIMFQPSPFTRNYGIESILYNGEFLAYSDAAGTNNYAPEGWQLIRTTATCAATALAGSAPRGRGLNISLPGPATDSLRQYLLLTPNDDGPSNTWYTLKGAMNIASGAVRVIVHNGTAAVASKTMRRTGTLVEFVIRFSIDLSTRLTAPFIMIDSAVAASTFVLYPMMLVRGVMPGPYERKHEIIKHSFAVTDANWSDSIVGTGTTAIDLSVAFGANIPRSVLGVLGRNRARDSLSSTGDFSYISVRPSNRVNAYGNWLRLGRLTNDRQSELQFFSTIEQDATWGFSVFVLALGTFRAVIQIMGVAT